MKKGIGPYGLGAPKAVGKQISKQKKQISKNFKEAVKFIASPGAYVVDKAMTQIIGSKGTGAVTPKKLPTLIKVPNGKEATQKADRGEKIVEGEIKLAKKKSYLKRKPVKPVNELKRGGLQKLVPATPRTDAKLQKLKPAKPKPQSKVAKPKKVKIKVKINKTKIKIKN